MSSEYLSISCLPAPTYVQSGHVVFNPGERHPNRNNFQFFVMMFMVRGKLYIAEDDVQYTVKAGEMFILQPKHHHYSWQPMDEQTEYYWVHFAVVGNYIQFKEPKHLRSIIQVPSLHYHTPDVTLLLKKHSEIVNNQAILPLIQKIFENSAAQSEDGFWQAQQLFIDLLQQVESQAPEKSSATILAGQVQRYLKDHFDEKITTEDLSAIFHVHPNSIINCMKKTYGITPSIFLTQYRLEEAIKRLLSTSEQISTIALDVGYQKVYYFSTTFKKYYGVSPLVYRKRYNNID